MNISKIFKVKEGKLDVFLAWCNELQTTRRKEAVESFTSEKVSREICVLLNGKDGNYYVVGMDEKTGSDGIVDMSLAVNTQHTKIRQDCLEAVTDSGKVLYDISA